MEDVNKEEIAEIEGEISRLQLRARRLKSEALCDHHYNGSDGCYECYCSGCGKHLREVRDSTSIPFHSDAFCRECQKTPEQKEQERIEIENRITEQELSTLKKLQKKYGVVNQQPAGQE